MYRRNRVLGWWSRYTLLSSSRRRLTERRRRGSRQTYLPSVLGDRKAARLDTARHRLQRSRRMGALQHDLKCHSIHVSGDQVFFEHEPLIAYRQHSKTRLPSHQHDQVLDSISVHKPFHPPPYQSQQPRQGHIVRKRLECPCCPHPWHLSPSIFRAPHDIPSIRLRCIL